MLIIFSLHLTIACHKPITPLTNGIQYMSQSSSPNYFSLFTVLTIIRDEDKDRGQREVIGSVHVFEEFHNVIEDQLR